jgi:hypothetical protein
MLRLSIIIARGAKIVLFGALMADGAGHFAYAASPHKVDSMLKQAIVESATPDVQPAPDTTTRFPVIIPEPALEPVITQAPMPTSDPIGLRAGGLLFLPSLLATQGYDDNIYTTNTNKVDDFITTLTPKLRVEIPDSRHEVALEGAYEFRKYWSNSDEDRGNARALAEGHLQAIDSVRFPFEVEWKNGYQDREEDLILSRSNEPLQYDDFKASAGGEFTPGRLILGLMGTYHKQRYEDGFSRATNTQIIRRDADRDIMYAEPTIGVQLNPEHALKLVGHFGERNYERRNFNTATATFNGPKRDSDTLGLMAGWHFDMKGLRGHLSAGAHEFKYDDPLMSDIREIVADMNITHDFNERTAFHVTASRMLDEDEDIIDPIVRSQIGAYLDHRVRNNILIGGGFDYDFREFDMSGRDDENWHFKALADYIVNDRIALGVEYIYSIRDSEAAGLDYERNQVFLKARGRL